MRVDDKSVYNSVDITKQFSKNTQFFKDSKSNKPKITTKDILNHMDYQGNINKCSIKTRKQGMPRELIDKYALQEGYKPVDYYIGNVHIIYDSPHSCIDENGHVIKKGLLLKGKPEPEGPTSIYPKNAEPNKAENRLLLL